MKPFTLYPKLLTKSRYMDGLKCPKLLWISVNQKENIPKPDETAQFRFDEGTIVGEYAKKLFPEGIDFSNLEFKDNINMTKDSLILRKPIFEAGIAPEGMRIYSRADILEPTGNKKDNEWNVIEVKSTTKTKDEHIQDVAFQKYCYEKSGLKIKKCFVMHLNSEYVRHGEINLKELFAKEDISEKVEEEIKRVPERIKEMLNIIDGKEPKVNIGEFCSKPHECPMMKECWKFLPENSVFDLYYGNKKAFELFEKGILAMKDIPEDFKLGDKQLIQKICSTSKKPHINKEGINKFLKTLKYPLYFLDFETYGTAIPIYDNLSPHQQIPFQFSLHKLSKEGKTEHFSFIAEGSEDPRKEFLKELLKVMGKKGSVVIYNQSFEQGRMEELKEIFKDKQKEIAMIIKRMKDLIVPFRSFHYYDCKQSGSCSIKDVLPALTGKSYEGMEISEGMQASLKYLWIIHGSRKEGEKPATKEEVKKVREDLEKYCGLDTQAMIDVLDVLRKSAE
jgi:hypothetical protein